MGWFRSAPDPAAQSLRPTAFDPGATRVSPGTRVVGRIEGTMEVVIDGELEGEVRLEGALLIGGSGAVRGEVAARVVRVAGRVTGDVRGLERIELLAGGSVEGNLTAPRVVVAEGAFLSGRVVMHDSSAAAVPSSRTPARTAQSTKAGESTDPPVPVPAEPRAEEPVGRSAARERGGKERVPRGSTGPGEEPR